MADLIKISPERVKDEANRVRDFRDEHLDIMSRLNNLVMILTESWEGEAQTAFVSKYQGMKNKFAEFEEMLSQVATDMDNSANKMQQTDVSLASRINSL